MSMPTTTLDQFSRRRDGVTVGPMDAGGRHPSTEMDGESDSDTNPDDAPEYYQPISAVDDSDSELENSDGTDSHTHSHSLPNGYYVYETEDGISRMDLNHNMEEKSSSSDDEEEEEEERMREESESEWAIRRAFREDENRRNAPLSQENAMRVMEAMRGVSFGGMAPDWTNQVPEDRWMDQLRRIRQPQRATPTDIPE